MMHGENVQQDGLSDVVTLIIDAGRCEMQATVEGCITAISVNEAQRYTTGPTHVCAGA